ncbi:NAD-dependent epimerase/dehydratase family protein [Roseateles saccharophilus]|uniref:Nucleoside-diphosphate-sugar epimerase n=1 Tax=Roseateles saccharophilus TaxID=304 RepID=A0A4V2VRI5_ROSSA|nr:NAD-dependent epimerase/dehydratase family protein [Roseateles saccharophilus]MDG0831487.1 NAD-dependent epimerase/dehydratase family protein [Roseateles saccharophilus]TCU98629.1 nucleoside-diphosphate-sugar epimerase [Roseateles saccharophilus]
MNILVIGAGGFIGRHLCAALAAAGHQARRAELRPATTWDRPEAWQPLLQGMDGVIYAAGCLRDQAGGVDDLLDLLHHRAPAALADACEAAGVGRLVHVSALCGGVSTYTRSKHAGEVALAGRACIVRPSLVVGVGGVSSRMLDLLARLPWLPLPAEVARCRVQPIRVEDLAAGIVAALAAPQPAASWTAVGPEAATVAEWIARRRAARGQAPARHIVLPQALTRASARLGDLIALGPWCSTALELLAHDSAEPPSASPLARPLRSAMEGAWA